jgi:hypothetical protein
VLVGHRLGLEKVALTRLIRAETGLGLKDAKACTDRLLEGNTVEVRLPSAAAARRFAATAAALGAVVAGDALAAEWRDVPRASYRAWVRTFSRSREGLDLSAACPVCGAFALHRYYDRD